MMEAPVIASISGVFVIDGRVGLMHVRQVGSMAWAIDVMIRPFLPPFDYPLTGQ